MIGVIADSADRDIVREFFELFKTPWEFYCRDAHYEILLCAADEPIETNAKLIVLYSGSKVHFDDERNKQFGCQQRRSCILSYQGKRIPIYGNTITFPAKKGSLLKDEESEESAAYLDLSGERVVARIGYDLFGEVRTLLTRGQPAAHAATPVLELHIAFLRNLIIGSGVSLVEIPPVPNGHPFIACLTHDVDHPSIRRHKLDHTVIGFLWRAVFGSIVDTFRGWMSVRDALKNWAAALKLPFVYAGLAKDFWSDFDDRYLELEKGIPSTFFVIPRKNYPGKGIDNRAAALRAARYEARELADKICRLMAAGCEVGLHGIDAWLDVAAGLEELNEIRRLTERSEIGVRMHWLYYSEKSPAILEKAGATYDSTVGYNDAVGYRSGSTQAFKPPEAQQLLELPMHAMDTALFYLSYLGLSPSDASARLAQIMDDAAQYGGCITINWHDRSLAPERLWSGCYRELIQDLKNRGAWFATARQAVLWFRKRRSAVFEHNGTEPEATRARVAFDGGDCLPGLRLRVHNARELSTIGSHASEGYVDVPVEENIRAAASCKSADEPCLRVGKWQSH